MYRTIPIKAKFTAEEFLFWSEQCRHANSLINCALYALRQAHYKKLEKSENAFTTYWQGDDLRSGWKTYKCAASYADLCQELKENSHYKAMAAR